MYKDIILIISRNIPVYAAYQLMVSSVPPASSARN